MRPFFNHVAIMLSDLTEKYLAKYEGKLTAGTFSDEDIKLFNTETTAIPDPSDAMTLILDFVSIVAPKMQDTILHNLVKRLIDMEFSNQKKFMRNSCIAKYFYAYQACYFPKQAESLFKERELDGCLGISDSDDEKKMMVLTQLQYTILGASQIALLLHMAKIKAQSSPLHAKKITELEKSSFIVYRALNERPVNIKPFTAFLARLIKFNDTLNSPSNTTYLAPLSRSEDDQKPSKTSSANKSATGRASLTGLFSRLLSKSRDSSASQLESRASTTELSSRPLSSTILDNSDSAPNEEKARTTSPGTWV